MGGEGNDVQHAVEAVRGRRGEESQKGNDNKMIINIPGKLREAVSVNEDEFQKRKSKNRKEKEKVKSKIKHWPNQD